jgi:hypothetical protein
MRAQVIAAAMGEVARMVDWLIDTPELDLAAVEEQVRDTVLALGAQVVETGLAARGTGKAGPRCPCPCGGPAWFEGYRSKRVQTLVGWIALRRAYYVCPACGASQIPLDAQLGLGRASHSLGVRRLASQFGALLPFTQAARALADAARLALSASTVRVLTEAVGTRREQEVTAQVATAWQAGLPLAPGPAPARLYVAMDGVRILDVRGEGTEAKVGVVRPERRLASGETRRAPPSYVASFAPAAALGPRLAVEAHRRGLEAAAEVVVLGDGAEWIWNLATEQVPTATQIVDWYHASERVWELGRALHGEGTAEAAAWVASQLDLLGDGQVADLVAGWQRLPGTGALAEVRDAQVTYFTNQARRMAYDRYRARGLDIGSGMVESACTALSGMREKGPGMRWSVAGAQAVANVRVLLFNDEWADYELAA